MSSVRTYTDLVKETGVRGATLRKCATIDYIFGSDEVAQRKDIIELMCPESWGVPKAQIERLRKEMRSRDIVPYNVYMKICTTMPNMEMHNVYVPVFREESEVSREMLQQRLELMSICIASEFKAASTDIKE